MSDTGSNEFAFIWKIDNYSLCYHKNGEVIESPVFTAESFGSCMWYLQLYPKGVNEACVDHISLYIGRCKKDPFDKEVSARLKFEIIDGNGDKVYGLKDTNYRKFANGTIFGCGDSISIAKIARSMMDWKEDTLTINCTLDFGSKQPACEARSKIFADICSLNMGVMMSGSCGTVKSAQFSFADASLYEMSVSVKADDVEIKIRQLKENSHCLKCISGKISLLDLNGVKTQSHRAIHLFEPNDDSNSWEFPSFISKSQLEDNKDVYLRNNSFTLSCEFSASKGMGSSNPQNTSNLICNLFFLQDDLHSMLTNHKHCDVHLQAEGVLFPVHKGILASRSPVFSANFDQDSYDILNIPDVSSNTMTSFLQFIYTGEVEMKDYEKVSMLLLVADRYQVLPLKVKCSDYLLSVLSVENVCELLVLADLVADNTLKQFAIDYAATHITEVSRSAKWSKWIVKNRKLLNEIIVHIAGDFQITRKNSF